MSYRLLVCGDRNWTDEEAIRCALAIWNRPRRPFGLDVVIHGDCRGADRLAGRIAAEMEIPVEAYPADWNKYGRAAGPIRNRQMLAEGKPTLVLAFHDDIEASKGTADMVEAARAAGVSAYAYTARSARRYRPSNGTEGDMFRGRFCDRCEHDQDWDNPCMIYGRSFWNEIEDEHYPDEWTYDEGGNPTCTAFTPITPTDSQNEQGDTP